MSKLKIDNPAFDMLEPIPPFKAEICDYYVGGEFTDRCYSTAGGLVSGHDNLVMMQTSRANNFELCLRIGNRWHFVATIPRDDAGIQQHRDAGLLTEAPLSAADTAFKARVEAREQETAEAQATTQRNIELHKQRERERRDQKKTRHEQIKQEIAAGR